MFSIVANSRQLVLRCAIACIIGLCQLQMVQAQCGCVASASAPQSSPLGPAAAAAAGSDEVHLIEGDILVSTRQILEEQQKWSSDTQKGNGSQNLQWSSTTQSSWYWPNGTLHYALSSQFTTAEASFIASCLLELQLAVRNAVTFKRVTPGQVADYVSVTSGIGCNSFVGRQRGVQTMSLQRSSCLHKYIVQHEFIHALGFWHEQSRSDRDKFVTIMWSFIDSRRCTNFGIYGSSPSSDFPPYDTNSIMHYDSFAFSCDGRAATIISKATGVIPYPIKLTDSDVLRIQYYYGAGDNSTRFSAVAQRNQQSQGWLVVAGSIVTGMLIVPMTGPV